MNCSVENCNKPARWNGRCGPHANKEWRKNNPTRVKELEFEDKCRAKGISTQDWINLFVWQGGVCAICKQEEPSSRFVLAIDHSHETGKVRALLCSRCNPALGYFLEDKERLKSAIQYLERHGK